MEKITAENASFFTQQPFLIGTYNEDGSAHFAPISWISYTWGPPSCLVISINGRTRKKQTTTNILRTGVLSATLITPDLLPFAEQNNRATHSTTFIPTESFTRGCVLDVPLIDAAKWSYECRVIQNVSIGECETFFAAIEHVNVSAQVQALDFYDLRQINPVIYSDNNYFSIGEHLGEIGDFMK